MVCPTTYTSSAERDVRKIIEEAAAGESRLPVARAQDCRHYTAYDDVAGIEARGLAPAKPYLDEIAAAKDLE